MENTKIIELRKFFEYLTNHHFLLKGIGIHDAKGAIDFINSHQEEEYIYEPFLIGLINQDDFYPNNPNKWVKMAQYCNYNHPAILNTELELDEGGPIIDWFIYPKLIKWLRRNAPNSIDFELHSDDKKFLELEISNTYNDKSE